MDVAGSVIGRLRSYRTGARRRWHTRSTRATYRFVVKDWAAMTDINLATDVASLDFLRMRSAPVVTTMAGLRTAVVLAPHQDDGMLGAGGALLLAREHKTDVHVIYVTDGEQRKLADSRAVRRSEALAVCASLGATPHELGISNLEPRPDVADVDRLSRLLADLRPDAIFSPWLVDSPAKHRLANHLLALSADASPLDAEVWGYQVHNAILANTVVDITDVAARKNELIRMFRSQVDLYARYDHTHMGLAAWNSRYLPHTGETHHAELFLRLPLQEFTHQVRRLYEARLDETYLGSRPLVESFLALRNASSGQASWESSTARR